MYKKPIYFKNYLLIALIALLITSCATENALPTEAEAEVETTAPTTEAITTEITTEIVERSYEELLTSNLEAWGLGKNLIDYVSNDRAYEWYLDQGNTGQHSDNNCGPTSIAMVGMWADEDFPIQPEDARKAFRPQGGWWYSDDINNSLELYGISYDLIDVKDHYTLRSIIDSGKIALINNTMNYIPYTSNENLRVGRFYTFDSGHYLIVKGYVLVDDKLYFEMYDPNNWWMTYADGTPMGKNRYYDSESLMASILNWYPVAVVIEASED